MASPPKTLRSDSCDVLVIGPLRAPGIVRDIDMPLEHKVDKSAGGATNGATLRLNGQKPVPVKIVLEWWDDPESEVENATHEELEIARYQALKDLCFPEGNAVPVPYDIVHPIADIQGVKSILIHKITSPKQVAAGRWQITIEATKFVPPPAKPIGVSSTPTSAKAADLAQKKKIALEQLADENSKTSAAFAAEQEKWKRNKQNYDNVQKQVDAANAATPGGFGTAKNSYPNPGPRPVNPYDPASGPVPPPIG